MLFSTNDLEKKIVEKNQLLQKLSNNKEEADLKKAQYELDSLLYSYFKALGRP